MTMKAAHPVIRLDCTPQISCLASLVIGYPISTGLKFPDLVEKEVRDSAFVPCERLWTLLGVYMAVVSRGICPVLPCSSILRFLPHSTSGCKTMRNLAESTTLPPKLESYDDLRAYGAHKSDNEL